MKIKKIIKEILIFLALLIMVGAVILPKELNNLDEIWNFNFARNVADGRLPYKDFNMIQTPLLPLICGLILKIVGSELIVMRLLACILCATILFMTYKILNFLKINNIFILIILVSLYFTYLNHFCIDYNFAILLITLITMYLELKALNKENNILKSNIKFDFGLGILVGTTILFKQTTGIFISIIFIMYKILMVSNKKDLKTALKIVSARLFGICVPIIALAIYLILNDLWADFINYAILGIKTFSNKISYISLFKESNIYIKILTILVPITIFYMFLESVVLKQKTKEDKNIFILFCYSVGSLIVVFPISDEIHFLIGSLPTLISFVYVLYLWLIKIKNFIEKHIKINIYFKLFIKYFFTAFVILSSTYVLANFTYKNSKEYIRTANYYTKINHYKYIPTNDKYVNKIVDFIKSSEIKGKKVYILDATAALYMIPADKCNKDYDMFLKGNLGVNGEDGQIEKLKNLKNNELILILNEKYHRNWQTPEKVIKYVKESLTKTGEIGSFDIYVEGEGVGNYNELYS